MQAPSELGMCSDLAQQAFACLLKMAKGSSIRTSTVLSGLEQRLGVGQIEVKGAVRELYRASLLRYSPDRQQLPVSGMVEIVRPEKTVSLTEQEWNQALDRSGLSAVAKEALRPFFCKVGGLTFDDQVNLVACLAGLESGTAGFDDAGFNVSARNVMGGSKVLSYLAPKMLQALGVPLRLYTSSPRYVLCAGPAKPESSLLIENPRAFENAVRSGLGEFVALVCTYGFGLSYLGQAWRDDAHIEDKPVQIVRSGTPPPLTDLLTAKRVFLWADLDLAALSIFKSLQSAIPQLRFSDLYLPMMEMAGNPMKSHPYALLFEKDGQAVNGYATFEFDDPFASEIMACCQSRGVDQEAVMESDILRFGRPNRQYVSDYNADVRNVQDEKNNRIDFI
ncbi:hypothetical protein HUU62_22335 [Rhodoferax sp. 4810]|nr:hypothetical protein [Rhodoferax jenense]